MAKFAYPSEIPSIDKFRGALAFAIELTVNLIALILHAPGDIVVALNIAVAAWLTVLFMVWRP